MADDDESTPAKAPPASPSTKAPTPAKEPTPKKAAGGAKAKAKAKGKSKAAPKPKAKTSCPKKPAAHVKQTVLKKPTAAPSALKDKAKTEQEHKPKAGGGPMKRPGMAPKSKAAVKPSCFAGLKDEEENEKHESGEQPEEENMEEDPLVEPADFDMEDETKNRSKNNKFLKLLKSGSLPDWLADEWDKTKKMSAGRREKQREIVNNAMEHTQDGRLILNVDKPLFQSMKETWVKTASIEREKSLPKLLLMGKFNMGEKQFEEALREGQIYEVRTKSGALQYAWGSGEHSTERGKSTKDRAEERNEGTKKEFQEFKANAKNWKIGLFQATADSKALASTSSKEAHGEVLALECGLTDKQWSQAQGQLSLAMQAFEKVISAAKKKLQQIGCDNKEDALWLSLWLGLQSGVGIAHN